MLKQRDGKANTLAPMESRALVSRSSYRRLIVSWSQPFILTLTRKVFGGLRLVFDLHMLKVKVFEWIVVMLLECAWAE